MLINDHRLEKSLKHFYSKFINLMVAQVPSQPVRIYAFIIVYGWMDTETDSYFHSKF